MLILACFAVVIVAPTRAEDKRVDNQRRDDKRRDDKRQKDDNLKAQPVTVPFELLKTQHMVIRVKINDKGPYRLIFDTGAPINLLNNKVAKEAEVLPKDFKAPLIALFGSVGQFKIKSLELGELKAEDLNCIVMDHPTIALISKHFGPIEGIVGFTFFAKYRMTLDYQAKTMTFTPTDFEPKDMIENLMKMLTSGKSKAKSILSPAGVLGIQVEKAKADEDAGVTIKEVLPDSAAAKAGLKGGDRLLTLDDRWTDSVLDCYMAASHLLPGTTVRAVISRDGKKQEVKIEVRAGL
jgi:hypothetical protein